MPPRRRHIGIADVADRAGVSVTTVSHVLSSRRPVSAATRERVRQAIEELGYRPNELARSMRTQRTSTIGLVIPDITNPFYTSVARGLQDILAPAAYYGIVCNTDAEPAVERAVVEQLVTRRVDGIAFAGYYEHDKDIQPAIAAGIPVVLLGARTPGPGYDAVCSDDHGGGRQAAEYLIERGYRRIAFITGPAGEGPPAERVAGYRGALAAAKIAADPELVVRVAIGREGGAEAMARLLDRTDPPDAVICTNDIVAIGALDTARQRGLRIPRDVAILGFDDIEAAALISPALTTMANPAREIGQAVGRLLLQRLDEPEPTPPQAIVFACRLTRRDSA